MPPWREKLSRSKMWHSRVNRYLIRAFQKPHISRENTKSRKHYWLASYRTRHTQKSQLFPGNHISIVRVKRSILSYKNTLSKVFTAVQWVYWVPLPHSRDSSTCGLVSGIWTKAVWSIVDNKPKRYAYSRSRNVNRSVRVLPRVRPSVFSWSSWWLLHQKIGVGGFYGGGVGDNISASVGYDGVTDAGAEPELARLRRVPTRRLARQTAGRLLSLCRRIAAAQGVKSVPVVIKLFLPRLTSTILDCSLWLSVNEIYWCYGRVMILLGHYRKWNGFWRRKSWTFRSFFLFLFAFSSWSTAWHLGWMNQERQDRALSKALVRYSRLPPINRLIVIYAEWYFVHVLRLDAGDTPRPRRTNLHMQTRNEKTRRNVNNLT